MKAKSEVYVQLQSLYKSKARADAVEILHHAQSKWPNTAISLKEVELFCRNAAFVRLVNSKGRDPKRVQLLAGG